MQTPWIQTLLDIKKYLKISILFFRYFRRLIRLLVCEDAADVQTTAMIFTKATKNTSVNSYLSEVALTNAGIAAASRLGHRHLLEEYLQLRVEERHVLPSEHLMYNHNKHTNYVANQHGTMLVMYEPNLAKYLKGNPLSDIKREN